jgi:hypothetical protein
LLGDPVGTTLRIALQRRNSALQWNAPCEIIEKKGQAIAMGLGHFAHQVKTRTPESEQGLPLAYD